MNVLIEGDLQVSFPVGATARKFDDDDNKTHGLSHCMKAVDFIVELDDRLLFVEFKDPDNPKAKEKDSAKFFSELKSDVLVNNLLYKYRDSYLYELASGRANKPIYFLVLIGAKALSEAELIARTDELTKKLPMLGANGKPWIKPFVAGCGVMNLLLWNKTLPQYPASRVSQ